MAFKVLFCSPVLLLVSLLHFATFAFSTTSSVAATAEVGKAFEEAEALLNWKASLDNQNKSLLSSWVGDRPCINWVGITCDDMELGVTRLNLSSFGLKELAVGTFASSPSIFDSELALISGSIPEELELLKHLWVLQLLGNSLTSPIPAFIGKMVELSDLKLAMNKLSGPIPTTIGNLTKLTGLVLFQNNLSGSIPASIGHLVALSILFLDDNKLSGSIPTTIGNMTKLSKLNLITNFLSCFVPIEMNNHSTLTSLQLSENNFIGQLPPKICQSGTLVYSGARNNHFTVGAVPYLTNLKISNNKISGRIPPKLGKATMLGVLNLSSNHLFGKIPSDLGRLKSLLKILLNNNQLSGNIPSEIGMLSVLDHSGSIPFTFGDSASLTSIDISYNELEGPIPNITAFRKAPIAALKNNKGLCGNVAGVSLLLCQRVNKTEDKPREVHNDNLFAIWSYDGKMVYQNIIEAKEEFDYKYCIGVGGFGSVYKAKLQASQVVAVKKLHLLPDGEISNKKDFMSEIHALTEIRHRNIIKLYGFCSHPKHSLLVYEFLEGGSLVKLLNNEEGAKTFDWIKRANVVKGVANALSYMHHDCDISNKNVLLDLEYVAHISDFSTARILKPNSSN
uniref:non-specific serine/threonine protein kinase n=1 Tax=Quercus lobata TaxID=97700 RepID=A0A7N2LWS3_QUELO